MAKTPLTTVKPANNGFIPGKDAILKAMELVTSSEAAQYLADAFRDRMSGTRLKDDSIKGVQKNLNDFVNHMKLLESTEQNPWVGGEIKESSAFERIQTAIAQKFSKLLPDKAFNFKCFVGEDSTIKMNKYSAEEQAALGANFIKNMSTSFRGWLGTQHLVLKQDVVYESTKDGKVQQKMDPNKLKAMIEDKNTGFEQYLRKQGKSAHVQVVEFTASKNVKTTEARMGPSAGG